MEQAFLPAVLVTIEPLTKSFQLNMKMTTPHRLSAQTLAIIIAAMSLAATAIAQSGTWINPNGGSWADSANWQGGIIAQGADSTADFSTLSLSADATVTLDGAQTIGTVIFGDRAAAHSWFLNTGAGGPLTFSGSTYPTAIIVSNQTATIGAELAGTQGLTQSGNGTLVLVETPGYYGGTTNDAGVFELLSSLNTSNNFDYNDPLVINGGVVESAATLNLDVADNSDYGSTNVMGAGTLRLVGTNNGSTSPDLFFAPDAYENYYYGAALDVSNLDLGDIQRYIFAITEHNAVAEYDPYEDARIDANIVGTGGITYIAQNSWTGSNPMECPLVLAGSNTFTGELEIQRGSVYLFNEDALAQTNELLMDPATTNNARLFLYGSGATVANLESSGAGNALIANGNVNNPISIAPATLTVNQTSNTVFGGVVVDGQEEYDSGDIPPGPLSVVKTGSGTLTFTAANTYSGSTTISEGELTVSAAQTGSGSFSVADGAALGIAGINGSGISISDLALGVSANTTVEFTFSGSPVTFQAPIITGSLEANGGANSVAINVYVNGAGFPVGQYPLIQYTGGSIGGSGAGFSAFHLVTLPPSVVGSLVNNTANNSIDLNVTTGTAPPSQNGTWINASGGSWVNSANWQGGNIAQGIGFTADFSTLSLSADATVTLDGPQTIGNLIFGNQANAHNWILNTGSSGTLTLRDNGSSPAITVNNQTATVGVTLVGAQGLTQNGSGTLVLVQPAGYTGGTTNNAGILELLGDFSTGNNSAFPDPLVVDGVVESGATLKLDVDQNNDSGSTNALGTGTLRLIGTTNSSTNPDLYFDPDAVANDYYGAALDVSNLDLGASQRYIFAITEHNAVAQYDPYEDARIGANIMGAGGITYIAQNTYGGSEPMECPLVLAGSNTFTGRVEIQRGSIYLFNASALVQTNELLMDPATTNNARLFLYGNGATVGNLESGGTGYPLVANGNLGNPITIAPATLTVVETSNTVFGGILLDGQYEYDVVGGNPPGPLSLLKSGPGTLTLTGSNGYSGSTAVSGGELVISTAQTNDSAFSLADGTALGIIGINTNGVTMSDLSLGVSGNTTLEFTFSGSPVSSPAPITTASLEANGGANSVALNIHATAAIPSGQYPLIHYTDGTIGGSGAGFSAFHLGTLPPSVAASLVNNTANDSIDLEVTTGTTTAPQFSGILSQTNGAISLSLTGTPGAGFSILASTNLALTPLSAWTVVGTGTFGAGVTTFVDSSSTNYPDRFYLISTP
jgi:autotransporter-associated beta strand protein